jgi:hypothetical protein
MALSPPPTSQIRTSSPEVTTDRPFAVNIAQGIGPACPASTASARPVSTSHSLAVLSSPAVRAIRPSGLKETA